MKRANFLVGGNSIRKKHIIVKHIPLPDDVSILQPNGAFIIQGILGTIEINLAKLDPTGLCFIRQHLNTQQNPKLITKGLNISQGASGDTNILTNSSTKLPGIYIMVHEKSHTACARLNTLASLITQSLDGVSRGFLVYLLLVGVGYRAERKKSLTTGNSDFIDFKLGQSHDIHFDIPTEVQIICVKPTLLCIYGIDKHKVTQIAASIRQLKPVEAYKGKGIRYIDETIHLKEGKKK